MGSYWPCILVPTTGTCLYSSCGTFCHISKASTSMDNRALPQVDIYTELFVHNGPTTCNRWLNRLTDGITLDHVSVLHTGLNQLTSNKVNKFCTHWFCLVIRSSFIYSNEWIINKLYRLYGITTHFSRSPITWAPLRWRTLLNPVTLLESIDCLVRASISIAPLSFSETRANQGSLNNSYLVTYSCIDELWNKWQYYLLSLKQWDV